MPHIEWIRLLRFPLISKVDADDGQVAFPVRELATLQALRHVLLTSSTPPAGTTGNDRRPGGGDDERPLTFELRGEPLTLVSVNGHSGSNSGGSNAALRRALERQTTVPCQLLFKNRQPPSIGNDHVRKAPNRHLERNYKILQISQEVECALVVRDSTKRRLLLPHHISFSLSLCLVVTAQVVAVNLTRPLAAPVRAAVAEEARMAAAEHLRSTGLKKGNISNSGSTSGGTSGGSSSPGAKPNSPGGGHGGGVALAALRAVQVTHFRGGPCDENEIVCCLVPGGRGQGWTVVNAAKLQAKHPGRRGDTHTHTHCTLSLEARALPNAKHTDQSASVVFHLERCFV